MESNLIEVQFFLDINWYFADYFNRLCVVASGGGTLPNFLFEEKSRNNEFHEIVLDLEERFSSQRNEKAVNIIVDLKLNENLNQYFEDFESLAKKGFYVYDKIDLNNVEDSNYLLVAHPIYNTETDPLPIDIKHLELIPKLKDALISRTNYSFSNTNFIPRNLIDIVNRKYRWKQ
jgi:hypothetical protein